MSLAALLLGASGLAAGQDVWKPAELVIRNARI
jgi:hypothetical protein